MALKTLCDYCGKEIAPEEDRAVGRFDRSVGGSTDLHLHDQSEGDSCYSLMMAAIESTGGARPKGKGS